MRADIRAGRAYVELLLRQGAFTKGLKGARQSLKQFGDDVAQLGRAMSAISLAMAVPFGLAVKRFADFDDQMREVQAVTQATASDMANLTTKARQLGAATSFTAVEVAALMAELGRAGFDPSQVEAMTGAVLDLARATKTDATLSAGIMAASIRQFNLQATDATRVADGFTIAANKSFNTVEALGESLSYAGPVANDFNMSLEETLAVLGSLGNVGIQGSNAGTAIRRILTITGAEADKLRGILGVSFKDSAGNARPLIDVLEEAHQNTKNLGTALRAQKFNEAFGLLGITAASALGKASVSTRQLLSDIQAAGGAAHQAAELMDAGIGGAFRRLKSAVEGVALALGDAFNDEITAAARVMTKLSSVTIDWIKDNQGIAKVAVAAALAIGGIGVSLLAVGTTAQFTSFALGGVLAAMGVMGASARGVTAPLRVLSDLVNGSLKRGWELLRGGVTAAAVGLGSLRISLAPVGRAATSAAAGFLQAGRAAGGLLAAGTLRARDAVASLGPPLARLPAQISTALAAANTYARSFALGFTGHIRVATRSAAHFFWDFGAEVRYALGRPLAYAKALSPQLVATLGGAWSRVQAAAGQAANSTVAAWQRASGAVQATAVSVGSSIGRAFLSVGEAAARRLGGAWSQASTRVATAWAPVGAKLSAVMAAASSKIAAVWAPIGGRISGPLLRVLPLVRQDWRKLTALAGTVGSGVVAAWRTVGPRMAAGVTTAMQGAFTRIVAMGRASAAAVGRGFSRGIGGVGRGLSGALGGIGMLAGLLGPMAGSFGALLTTLPLVVSSVGAVASGLLSLVTPFGLVAAAIGGGIFLWTRYSETGKAALGSVLSFLAPFVATFKQTFAGLRDAIATGDWELAGQIAMAGLKLGLLQGVTALSEAVGGAMGDFIGSVGTDLASGDLASAWGTTLMGLQSLWAGFTEGITALFTQAMRLITDAWEGTTGKISDWILESAGEGGILGAIGLAGTGVDMVAEKEKAKRQQREQVAQLQRQLLEAEGDLAAANAAGGQATIDGVEVTATDAKARIDDLRKALEAAGEPVDAIAKAKQDARGVLGSQADAMRRRMDDLDRAAQERSRAAGENVRGRTAGGAAVANAAAVNAAAELKRLSENAQKAREAAAADEEEKKRKADAAAQGGQAAVSHNLSRDVVGSFSAAALSATGAGMGSGLERAARDLSEAGKELRRAAYEQRKKDARDAWNEGRRFKD